METSQGTGQFMHINVEERMHEMSTKIPVGVRCPDPWFNAETTLWDVTHVPRIQPLLLTSQERGYIGIEKVYGMDGMDHVLLQGRLPDAGPYLIDGLENAALMILEVLCGTRDDYEIQDLICRISCMEVVERQVPDLVAMSPGDAGLVIAYVLLRGKVEWFWKGQGG